MIKLAARGIVKRFPGVTALNGVDFDVAAGEIHGLIGENGAGKTTLMHILAGVTQPDAGQILWEGETTELPNTRAALDRGIAIVYQELNLVPHLSVAENIFLGRELRTRLGLVNHAAQNGRAAELLRPLDPTVDSRAEVASLRVGQQQIVEIAKALNHQASILFFDEPTSAISDHEVDVLFELIRTLRGNGIAVVYVSHKLDELFRLCDTLTVLRDGRLVETLPRAEIDHAGVVRRMVGRDLGEMFPEQDAPAVRTKNVLRVEKLSLQSTALGSMPVDDVSFTVDGGEVLGVFGLMGAGRTELLESIFGLHPAQATGEIYVAGQPCRIDSPRDAIAAGLALVPEDRQQQGLVTLMTVLENVTLASLEKAKRGVLLDRRREIAHARPLLDRLVVKTASLDQRVDQLSGGNQQKVVLAKSLGTRPRVLLLDEPTRGVDVGAKREIYRLVHELKRQRLAIIWVSSELPELLGNADRILVMCEGRKTGEFTRAAASQAALMSAAVPGVHAHA